MKKPFLFLLLFFFVSFAFRAQNWCPPGARWIYHVYSNFLEEDALVEYRYTKDTLMYGKQCKQILGTYAGKYSHYVTYTVIPNMRSYFSYEEDRVLYAYNGFDGFDTVANYAAGPGDVWLAPRKFQCSTRAGYTVKDTATNTVNGFALRTMTVTSDDDFPGYPIEFELMEKVFPIYSTSEIELFPFNCKNYYSDYSGVTFNCYSDDLFGEYNPGVKPCIRGVGLLPTRNALATTIGPSPFCEFLLIENVTAGEVNLFDAGGNTVFEGKIEGKSLRINTETLPPSLYLLRVTTESGSMETVKVIKN